MKKNQNLNSIKNVSLLFFIGLLFVPTHGSLLKKSVTYLGNNKKLLFFLASTALFTYRVKTVYNKIKEIDKKNKPDKNAAPPQKPYFSKIFEEMLKAYIIGDTMGASTEFIPNKKEFFQPQDNKDQGDNKDANEPNEWNDFYAPGTFLSDIYKKYMSPELSSGIYNETRVQKISFTDDTFSLFTTFEALRKSMNNESISYADFTKNLATILVKEYKNRENGFSTTKQDTKEGQDNFIIPGVHLTGFTEFLAPGAGMEKAVGLLSITNNPNIENHIKIIENDSTLCGSGVGMRCLPHAVLFEPYQAAVTTMLNGQLTHNAIGYIPAGLQAALYSAIIRGCNKEEITSLMLTYATKFAPTIKMKITQYASEEHTLKEWIEKVIEQAKKDEKCEHEESIDHAKNFFETYNGKNGLTLFLASLYTYYSDSTYEIVRRAAFQSKDIDCDTLLASCLATVAAQDKEKVESDEIMNGWMNVIKSMDDDMILEHASENKFGTSEFKYKKDIKIDSLPLAQSQITLFINQSVKEVFHMTEQKILFKYDGETELAIGKDVVLQKGILETPEDCKMPVRKIEEEKREEKKPANYKTFIKIFFNLNS